MQKEIKNLSDKERMLVLNLQNTMHKVNLYRGELKKIKTSYELGDLEKEGKWFNKIFKYYQKKLIPAIQETAEMELRHAKIFSKNPDSDFQPQLEIQNHQLLTKQFLKRFGEVHHSFEAFKLEVKKNAKQ